MMGRNTKIVLLGICTIILILLGVLQQRGHMNTQDAVEPVLSSAVTRPEQSRITIGTTHITALVARTPATQEQGLSGRETLAMGTGLLFVFDTSNQYFFWMKGMKFPIDIIWIGEDHTIVDITHDADPSSYPAAFTSRGPAVYVLEVAAGMSRYENFQLGEQVMIEWL